MLSIRHDYRDLAIEQLVKLRDNERPSANVGRCWSGTRPIRGTRDPPPDQSRQVMASDSFVGLLQP